MAKWRVVNKILVPCRTGMVPGARDEVARHVLASGLPETRDDAALVTSEIVATAITHGSPGALSVLLQLEVAAEAVRISVADHSDQLPVLREVALAGAADNGAAPELVVGGQGLRLVDSLATAWGSRPCERPSFIKVVRAELARVNEGNHA